MFNLNNFLYINILSHPKNIAFVRNVLESFFKGKVEESKLFEIIVSLDESIANIIIHGYTNEYDHQIHISFMIFKNSDSKEYLEIKILYYADPIPVEKIYSTVKFRNKLNIGKQGVYIILHFMDKVDFLYQKKKNRSYNIISMLKNIS